MLYGAHLVRYDLLRPICSIAGEASRWTVACDKRLERLVSYIHSTLDHSLESFVGDPADKCHVLLYSDADFAGDMHRSKSTSGMYVAIVGPNTFAPVAAHCKKQTCVSHSSTESEIVAAELAIRSEGLQILTFWEHVTLLFCSRHCPPDIATTEGLSNDPFSANYSPLSYFLATEPGKRLRC